MSSTCLATSGLLISGGILGDTIVRLAERIAEPELGAGVGTFGGVEVIEQTLDRLEARRVITDWSRDEWEISTSMIGLDVAIEPIVEEETS